MLFPEDVNVDRPRWVVISAIWSASQFSARGPARGGGEPTICVHTPEIYKTLLLRNKRHPRIVQKHVEKKTAVMVSDQRNTVCTVLQDCILYKSTRTQLASKSMHISCLQTFSCKVGSMSSNTTAYLGVCASAVLRLQTLVWVACSSRMQEESSSGSHSTREQDRGISCRGTRSCENDLITSWFSVHHGMYLMMKSRWVILNHQMRVHL